MLCLALPGQRTASAALDPPHRPPPPKGSRAHHVTPPSPPSNRPRRTSRSELRPDHSAHAPLLRTALSIVSGQTAQPWNVLHGGWGSGPRRTRRSPSIVVDPRRSAARSAQYPSRTNPRPPNACSISLLTSPSPLRPQRSRPQRSSPREVAIHAPIEYPQVTWTRCRA